MSHVRSVVTPIFKGCNEILGHMLRSLEVIGRIVTSESPSFSSRDLRSQTGAICAPAGSYGRCRPRSIES
jgi:hypothetical protein